MDSRSRMREVDVLVVGAGPAGATTALNLAPTRRVALIDQRAQPPPRLGESLPPAARRLLYDIGPWGSLLPQGHSPLHCNRPVSRSPPPRKTTFLPDPPAPLRHLPPP